MNGKEEISTHDCYMAKCESIVPPLMGWENYDSEKASTYQYLSYYGWDDQDEAYMVCQMLEFHVGKRKLDLGYWEASIFFYFCFLLCFKFRFVGCRCCYKYIL